jgi:hypothetical protein
LSSAKWGKSYEDREEEKKTMVKGLHVRPAAVEEKAEPEILGTAPH